MYSEAPTEETAVGESEEGSEIWEADDALLEEGVIHSPIYDNTAAPYYYGMNMMQAQQSAAYIDRAHMTDNSDEDFEAIYDNVRHNSVGGAGMMMDQGIYDNRAGIMAMNMPSTLQEVMKTFYSGEDYLVNGSESEDDSDDDCSKVRGGAAGNAAASLDATAAADSSNLNGLHAASLGADTQQVRSSHRAAHNSQSGASDILSALNASALADESMAEAEF